MLKNITLTGVEYSLLIHLRNCELSDKCVCHKKEDYCKCFKNLGLPSKYSFEKYKHNIKFKVNLQKFNYHLTDTNIGIFDYYRCIWTDCYLECVNFHHDSITLVIFFRTILYHCKFIKVNITNVNFDCVNIKRSEFIECQLDNVKFDTTSFDSVKFDNCSIHNCILDNNVNVMYENCRFSNDHT